MSCARTLNVHWVAEPHREDERSIGDQHVVLWAKMRFSRRRSKQSFRVWILKFDQGRKFAERRSTNQLWRSCNLLRVPEVLPRILFTRRYMGRSASNDIRTAREIRLIP
jgi:hypothetical protein